MIELTLRSSRAGDERDLRVIFISLVKEETDTVAWYALQVQRTQRWNTLTINTRRKVLDLGKRVPRDDGIVAGR